MRALREPDGRRVGAAAQSGADQLLAQPRRQPLVHLPWDHAATDPPRHRRELFCGIPCLVSTTIPVSLFLADARAENSLPIKLWAILEGSLDVRVAQRRVRRRRAVDAWPVCVCAEIFGGRQPPDRETLEACRSSATSEGYGRARPDIIWPNGARMAVSLVVNF